jgi:DNA modification methylase
MIRLLHGDCRDVLKTLADASVHACITSPPYYSLRSYLHADHPDKHREIGSEPTPDEYLATMVGVFREIRRVLRPDGVCWVNMGDSYAAQGGGGEGRMMELYPNDPSRWNGVHAHAGHGQISGGGGKRPSLPPKNLMMMPARLALALQADGWWLRSMLPWLKRSAMPESVTDRPASAVEYVFLLTKSARYFFDSEAVKRGAIAEPQNRFTSMADQPKGAARTAAGIQNVALGGGGTTSSRNMRNSDLFYDSLEPEPVAKPLAPRHTKEERKARGEPNGSWRSPANVGTYCASGLGAWDGGSSGAPLGLICSDAGEPLALDVNPQAFSGAHFACFPEKLVSPLIRAGTSQYGCCAACGAPWRRQTEAGAITASGGKGARYQTARLDSSYSPGTADDVMTALARVTTGWAAGCACQAAVVPCVVLDPFMGSGTVGLVCDRLQRDAIGIELSDAYGAMATGRVEQDAPLFAGVVEEPPNVAAKAQTTPRNDGERWMLCDGHLAPGPSHAAKAARIVDDAPLLAWGAMAEAAG